MFNDEHMEFVSTNDNQQFVIKHNTYQSISIA